MASVFFFVAMMAQAAATPTSSPAAPVDPLDKIRCQREIETGSLVKSKRVCHTRREWQRISDDAQAEADRLNKHTAVVPNAG